MERTLARIDFASDPPIIPKPTIPYVISCNFILNLS